MNVDIEFYSEEPLENVITCLNYNIDRVIFIGFQDMMTESSKESVEEVLEEVAGIVDIRYLTVSRNDLDDIICKMDKAVHNEIQMGNSCYLDITGGEELVLVAAGIIAERYKCPMHRININSNILHEFNMFNSRDTIRTKRKENCHLNIEQFVKLHQGSINYRAQKDYKICINSAESSVHIKRIWKVFKKFQSKWNGYANIIKYKTNTNSLKVVLLHSEIQSIMSKCKNINSILEFMEFLKSIQKIKVISNLHNLNKRITFKFNSDFFKKIICDPGSILEMYTYITAHESGIYDDCSIGVHLDWDMLNKGQEEKGVLNEIDLLLIKDNLPLFISCKCGAVDHNALYELETVAKKFGGKYADKLIVSSLELGERTYARAQAMGINVVEIIQHHSNNMYTI